MCLPPSLVDYKQLPVEIRIRIALSDAVGSLLTPEVDRPRRALSHIGFGVASPNWGQNIDNQQAASFRYCGGATSRPTMMR